MKHSKQLLLAAALAAGLSDHAFAQQAAPADHGAHHPQAAATATADLIEGEVRKVDKSTGKITLKHGEIKNLDMPPMTMVFGVSDAKMLDKVKQGDKVRFRAASQDGKFTVTEVQVVAH